jgi:glycosyltransferase involved in cell wall biosynthesis
MKKAPGFETSSIRHSPIDHARIYSPRRAMSVSGSGPEHSPAPAPDQPPLCVLQVLPRLESGGVERGCVDMAIAVQQAGGTAIVASQGGAMVREITRAGAVHVTLPLATKNPFGIWRNVARLARVIREHNVTLVHARSRAPAWSARAAAAYAKVPFITTFHAWYSAGNGWKKRYNAIMAKGETVIAISDFIASHLREDYGVEDTRIVTIPRGIDPVIFAPEAVSTARLVQLAESWNVPAETSVILVPGRLSENKGQAIVLEALAQLLPLDGLRVVFVGPERRNSRLRARLEAQARTLGVASAVQWVGACSDMAAAYRLATLVVAPSTKPEAFGRVAVEAQAMGKPVIATDLGGFRETVRPGETGWLVAPKDAAALARAIREALAMDEAARARMAEAGRAWVDRHFTKERMCAATLAVYRRVLAEHAAPADAAP